MHDGEHQQWPGQDGEDRDEGDEDLDFWVMEVRKMQLTLTPEVDYDTGKSNHQLITDEDTIIEAARMLKGLSQAAEERRVCGIVAAEDELPGEDAAKARKMIEEKFNGRVYRDRILPDPPERGSHGKAKLHLKPNAVPVTSRTIHLAGERLQALKELESEWKRDNKIDPGRGPWRAAAFPIKKKSGKWRIHQDSYPLPLTENIVAEMAACELFSTIDLRDAFHQVALDEESRWITCIQLPGGLWQWRVVPQGINVGPALIQRDIDSTCSPIDDIAKPYFDDIIVGTRREAGMTEGELVR